jgi:hypothetical protein
MSAQPSVSLQQGTAFIATFNPAHVARFRSRYVNHPNL